LCVVGPKEAESDSLGVRSRDKGELGAMKVDDVIAMIQKESRPPTAS
jgi:threonyl-tRNA synthetase